MAPDYTTYLATNILNDEKIVTYRLLSHEFKIHANAAKKILADFYSAQNAKSKGSVFATYLVSGLQEAPVMDSQAIALAEPAESQQPDDAAKTDADGDAPKAEAGDDAPNADADGDTPMPSSPLMSSSAPQPSRPSQEPASQLRKVMTVVQEEELEAVKAAYKKVTAVHVYSLQSVSPKDIQVVSQPNREIAVRFANEDPLEYVKKCGIIENPDVKRRTPHGAKVIGAATPVEKSTPIAKPSPAQGLSASKPASKSTGKPATLKKEASDLFKSFAKAKPKPPVKEPAKSEDAPMQEFSDDDAAEEPVAKPDMTSTKLQAERQSREQRLRALMDDDDDLPMSNADEEEESEQEEPEPEPEPELADEPALKQEPAPEEEEAPNVTVSDGRRRGKRKIMKKVMMKDEEGYLITKEEPAWESFSEDDTPTSSSKPTSMVSSGKPKASGKAQGNIMSFFGKK